MTTEQQTAVTRPIIGIQNRTAQEVFNIMCDRFRLASQADQGDRYREAVACVVATGRGSTSLVQRVLHMGYNEAVRLVERMEREGVLSKPNSAGKRDVRIHHMRDLATHPQPSQKGEGDE